MIQRVNGSLAVSRALGDFEYKNVDGKGNLFILSLSLYRYRFIVTDLSLSFFR